MLREAHPRSFAFLSAVFALFILFLYAPTATIVTLSFQGPEGGLVFPMRGSSLHWIANVFQPQSVGDIGGSFQRSIQLALVVAVLTVAVSFLAGLAFRRGFRGSGLLFYLVVASLIMPSVVVSLGIGSPFCFFSSRRARGDAGPAPRPPA